MVYSIDQDSGDDADAVAISEPVQSVRELAVAAKINAASPVPPSKWTTVDLTQDGGEDHGGEG